MKAGIIRWLVYAVNWVSIPRLPRKDQMAAKIGASVTISDGVKRLEIGCRHFPSTDMAVGLLIGKEGE